MQFLQKQCDPIVCLSLYSSAPHHVGTSNRRTAISELEKKNHANFLIILKLARYMAAEI
jgi:hypothetical protein